MDYTVTSGDASIPSVSSKELNIFYKNMLRNSHSMLEGDWTVSKEDTTSPTSIITAMLAEMSVIKDSTYSAFMDPPEIEDVDTVSGRCRVFLEVQEMTLQ